MALGLIWKKKKKRNLHTEESTINFSGKSSKSNTELHSTSITTALHHSDGANWIYLQLKLRYTFWNTKQEKLKGKADEIWYLGKHFTFIIITIALLRCRVMLELPLFNHLYCIPANEMSLLMFDVMS